MNETIYEGKTLDEALSQAAESLSVAPEELAYEVTEENDGGFWGLDEAYVRLRAWQRPEAEETTEGEAPAEQEEAAAESEAEASLGEEDIRSEPQTEPPAEEAPSATTPADTEPEPSAPAAASGFWAADDDKAAAEPEAVDVAPTPSHVPRPEDTQKASAEATAAAGPVAAEPSATAPQEEGLSTEEAPGAGEASREDDREGSRATGEDGDKQGGPEGDDAADAGPEIERLVTKILAGMDFDCTIDVQAEADVYMAMVGGADKELLLEGNGRPLSALELILNHAFRHRLTERRKIRVDAGDFRSRREDELRDLAYQVAHSAKESEQTQETQPLNPYERRLVHLALAEDSGVTTRSRGSGFLKNVQVIPRRSGRGNR